MKKGENLEKKFAKLTERYLSLKTELSEILKEGAEIQQGLRKAIDEKKMAGILNTIKKQS